MRGAVVGAAVVMAAAVAGLFAFAWTALSGPSGKPREGTRVTRSDDRAAQRRDRPDRPRGTHRPPPIDEPAAAPTARRIADDDRDDGRDDDRAPAAPGGAVQPPGSLPRPGVAGAAEPGEGVDPGVLVGPGARPGAGSPGGALGGPIPAAWPVDAGSACPRWMVDTGAFCIDATEVTNVAYGAFLAAKPNGRLQPASCSWNVDFTPSGGPPASDVMPVVGVDWCDAWLFCASSGKRLCGQVGSGGNNPPGDFAKADRSEWYSACTNGGVSAFSYGDAYDGGKCTHAGEGGTLRHAGSIPSCVGATPPYDAVFDMSGNAGEWEDSCAGDRGASDLCRVRGSSSEQGCTADALVRRDQTSTTVGFRCCAGYP